MMPKAGVELCQLVNGAAISLMSSKTRSTVEKLYSGRDSAMAESESTRPSRVESQFQLEGQVACPMIQDLSPIGPDLADFLNHDCWQITYSSKPSRMCGQQYVASERAKVRTWPR